MTVYIFISSKNLHFPSFAYSKENYGVNFSNVCFSDLSNGLQEVRSKIKSTDPALKMFQIDFFVCVFFT